MVGSEIIRSGNVSDAITEILREETWLSRESAFSGGKDTEGKRAVNRTSSKGSIGSEGRDRP